MEHHHTHDINVKIEITNLDQLLTVFFHNINSKLDKIMATFSDLQAAVAAEDTVIDSAVELLKGLAAQIAALKPTQEAIDALAADITAKTAALSQAVVENTSTE